MGGNARSKLPARSPFLPDKDLRALFRFLDKDDSGTLTDQEVQRMYEAMLGGSSVMKIQTKSYAFEAFKKAAEDAHLRHPSWNVAGNLMNYIEANVPKPKGGLAAGALEEDAGDERALLTDALIDRLCSALGDGPSGAVGAEALLKVFRYKSIPGEWLEGQLTAEQLRGGAPVLLDLEAVSRALRQIHAQHPEKELPARLREYLRDHARNGFVKHVTVQLPCSGEAPLAEEASGKKKALLVGVNYAGSAAPLRGCGNDARKQRRALTQQFGFEEGDVRLLCDDGGENGAQAPTAENIRSALAWFSSGNSAGDLLFFAYSGCGSVYLGESEEAPHECICPSDCNREPWPRNVIQDAELQKVHDELPAGAHLVAVLDCCSHGTDEACLLSPEDQKALDADARVKYLAPPPEVQERLDGLRQGIGHGPTRELKDLADCDAGRHVWAYCACQDGQTCLEASFDGEYQGAWSWALLQTLQEHGCSPHEDVLDSASRRLRSRGIPQVPSVCSTHPDNLRKYFLARAAAAASA